MTENLLDLNSIGDLNALPSIVLPYTGAILGSQLLIPNESFNDSEWYRNLEKPWYQPPNIVFPIVWTFLYASMGYASYLVYKEDDKNLETYPLFLYGLQLFLNWSWTPILFRTKNLNLVLFETILLWIAVAATANEFYHVSQDAGIFMLPYLGWTTFALRLTYDLATLNPTNNSLKKI